MIEFGPRSKDKVSFDTALLYCMTLDHEGYCNWRLPVADETVFETLFEVEVWVNENEKIATDNPYQSFYVIPVRDINVY